ncbi:sensor histidine kinase [Rivibacter subsaxonicus]|uniref:Two-component system sensor histidine kinase AlgZ n=1 Tax=Rivibacter subsaxonicus TaxID=457575 RepID=A0A4Q7VGZ8_9BURK|nr:histidine kinase [Rivibacter subsaxonicus]RZT95331.1 two-component system sensor histidine kinase AlgZ [Rivibacter subsaxonicus]
MPTDATIPDPLSHPPSAVRRPAGADSGAGTEWPPSALQPMARTARAAALKTAGVFDVCHVGFVLRAVLVVHAGVAIATGFGAATALDWLLRFASASLVVLPALLLWLLLTCGLKRWLEPRTPVVQGTMLVALGAGCGLLATALLQYLGPEALAGPTRVAAVLAGAATAFGFFVWLRQRARQEAPAAVAARLAELQARIRPHFLFNALNSAIALVRVDPGRAEEVLENLGELFRVALEGGGRHAVATLNEEIELARRYLDIEKVRFGDRLQIQWDLDERAGVARLPPLLLQPLVENAVRHGIEPLPNGGIVRVRTRRRAGEVLIEVRNPMPTGPARSDGHGVALGNVRERLRLLHDLAADFRTGVEDGQYRVRIVVPI